MYILISRSLTNLYFGKAYFENIAINKIQSCSQQEIGCYNPHFTDEKTVAWYFGNLPNLKCRQKFKLLVLSTGLYSLMNTLCFSYESSFKTLAHLWKYSYKILKTYYQNEKVLDSSLYYFILPGHRTLERKGIANNYFSWLNNSWKLQSSLH